MATNLATFIKKLDSSKEYSLLRNTRFYVSFRWNVLTNSLLFEKILNQIDIKDFDFYVKTINIPNLKMGSRSMSLDEMHEANPGYSTVIMPNSLVIPQEQTFGIEFYDTEISIIDNLITPWLKACASMKGTLYGNSLINKSTVSYPTATITVYIFGKSAKEISPEGEWIRKYTITKVWPNIIDSPELNQENSEFIVRKVEFNFNKCIEEKR